MAAARAWPGNRPALSAPCARCVRGRTRPAPPPAAREPQAVSANDELLALQRALYESRNPTRRWLHCTRRDWIAGRLTRLAADGRRAALEVGPGSGVYVPLLARLFERVTVKIGRASCRE